MGYVAFTTDRMALGDQLHATFQGQSCAARVEVGYRFALSVAAHPIGIAPYAALQAQKFRTPAYQEADLTGGGLGLSYAAMNGADTRSELGPVRQTHHDRRHAADAARQARLGARLGEQPRAERLIRIARGRELHGIRRARPAPLDADLGQRPTVLHAEVVLARQVRRRIRPRFGGLCRHGYAAFHVVKAPADAA